MENMNQAFYNVKATIGEMHNAFKQGIEWWKQEMDNLKAQLASKDREIAELKKQLNAKSS